MLNAVLGLLGSLVLGVSLSCSAAGTGDSAGSAVAEVWLADIGDGSMLRIEIRENSIRYDQTTDTVEFGGLRGTYSLVDSTLTAVWTQELQPYETGDSYTPFWTTMDPPTEEVAMWKRIDDETLLAGPEDEPSEFFRVRPIQPPELIGYWSDYDNLLYLELKADGTYDFTDTEDPTGDISGTWTACNGYLCLHITEKAGYLPGVECDFFYVSAYSVTTEGDSTELVLDLFNGTYAEPSSISVTFFPYALP